MTQTNGKRDYKHAYKLQKKTGETADQVERQKARRAYDKKGVERAYADSMEEFLSALNAAAYDTRVPSIKSVKKNKKKGTA